MPPSKDPRICWETEFFYEKPIWSVVPDLENVKKVITPYLRSCGFEDSSVTFFAEGSFNKLFAIRATGPEPGDEQEFIFRVPLPVQPYYKTESEVATCEYVRLHTTIPAPRIFAWDSSSDNKLGFEWILMEKLPGTPLRNVWESLDYETKVRVTRRVAEWMDQLSRCRFEQIGSLYQSSKPKLGRFEVGQAVSFDLYRGRCLQFDIYRGPFQSAEQYYQAVIYTHRADVNDYAIKVLGEAVPAEEPALRELEEKWQDKDLEEDEQGDGMMYDMVDLIGIPKACDALLGILPKVFPSQPAGKPAKVLYHHDISLNNVLVDGTGNLVGLVDWENILTVPYALAYPYPVLLESTYGEDMGPLLDRPRPSDTADDETKKTYDDAYEKRQLQKVFREHLEDLRSPWLQAFKEATVLVKEFNDNMGAIVFSHPRTLEWIEELEGREGLEKL
ncbi:MAG: hypothetical protein M1830_005248, partial [Pleopsidium flavum]